MIALVPAPLKERLSARAASSLLAGGPPKDFSAPHWNHSRCETRAVAEECFSDFIGIATKACCSCLRRNGGDRSAVADLQCAYTSMLAPSHKPGSKQHGYGQDACRI